MKIIRAKSEMYEEFEQIVERPRCRKLYDIFCVYPCLSSADKILWLWFILVVFLTIRKLSEVRH